MFGTAALHIVPFFMLVLGRVEALPPRLIALLVLLLAAVGFDQARIRFSRTTA